MMTMELFLGKCVLIALSITGTYTAVQAYYLLARLKKHLSSHRTAHGGLCSAERN